MIEKIKDYLYFDENRDGELEGFSLINVYPYLSLSGSEVSLLEDEKRAVLHSHHISRFKYTICVRSKEAQNELYSIFIANGYPVTCVNDCEIGLNSSELKDFRVSVVRRWFSLSVSDINIARDI